MSPVAEAVARGASRAEVEQLLRDRFDRGLAWLDTLVIEPALEQHAAVILKTLPFSRSWDPDVNGLLGVVFRSWAEDQFERGIGRGSEALYERVRKLEDRPMYGRLVKEEWSSDLAGVMAEWGWRLRDECLASPVRMTMMCGVLEEALSQGEAFGERSTLYDQLLARIRTITEEVAPFARATLIEQAHSSDSTIAHDAVVVLLFIGAPDDLKRVPAIGKINVPAGKVLSEEQVLRIGLLTSLRHLSLVGLTLDGAKGLSALCGLPLETLSLRAGHIYNYDLGFLLANTSLWSLDVGYTLLNDNAIPRLSQFKLESLDIAGARFTDEGVRALRERFPLATIVT